MSDPRKPTGIEAVREVMAKAEEVHPASVSHLFGDAKRLKPRAQAILDATTWAGSIVPCLEGDYLIKGWLNRGMVSVVYGPSNVGKSFLAVDLAHHISKGFEWGGRRVAKGRVLYIAAEGGNAFRNRVAALDAPEFFVLSIPLTLTGKDSAAVAVAEVVQHLGAEFGKVKENGEFTAGVINDAGEAFAVEIYGKICALTRQALVNDDLGSFEQSSRMFGQGAALTEARLFAGLLEMNAGAGPTLADGRTLFHADHSNCPADSEPNGHPDGAALSIQSLSVARVAMRRQKGLSGEAIQVQPSLLVVPLELETAAQKLVAEFTAASVDEVNPFTDTLAVLVDAHLTSPTRWLYLSMGSQDVSAGLFFDELKACVSVDLCQIKLRQRTLRIAAIDPARTVSSPKAAVRRAPGNAGIRSCRNSLGNTICDPDMLLCALFRGNRLSSHSDGGLVA